MNKLNESESITWKGRLVSLMFIALIWLFTRLISELDGISWQRSFYWIVPLMFGIFPASIGFLIAVFAKNRVDQRWYRCFSWWSIPIALISGFLFVITGFPSQIAEQLSFSFQIVSFVFIHIIYHFKYRKGV